MTVRSWDIAEFILGTLPEGRRSELARRQKQDRDFAERVRQMKVLIEQGAIDVQPGADAMFKNIMSDLIGRFSERTWNRTQPGFEIKELWNRDSLLVRCHAGTIIPAHKHHRTEVALILDGEARFGNRHLSTGAWEVNLAGSQHEEGEALEDCLFMIQYS